MSCTHVKWAKLNAYKRFHWINTKINQSINQSTSRCTDLCYSTLEVDPLTGDFAQIFLSGQFRGWKYHAGVPPWRCAVPTRNTSPGLPPRLKWLVRATEPDHTDVRTAKSWSGLEKHAIFFWRHPYKRFHWINTKINQSINQSKTKRRTLQIYNYYTRS